MRRYDGGKTAAVVGMAVAVRLAAMLSSPTSMLRDPSADPDAYAQFAHTLIVDRVYGPSPDQPSAFRPPLYPMLIAPFCIRQPPWTWGVAGLHLIAAALTAWGTVRLAAALGAGRFALFAGFLVACDPLLVKQSTEIMTETVSSMLFVWLCWTWAARVEGPMRAGRMAFGGGVAAGALLALNVMTRPTAWAFWIVVGVFNLRRRSMTGWLVATIVAMLCCLPWIIRNSRVLGRPILTTTHGGYTLWLGQNPVFFQEVVAANRRIWPDESFQAWTKENLKETQGQSELQRDAYYRDQAWKWMTGRPAEWARSVLFHLSSFWSPTPAYGGSTMRWACGCWYSAMFLAAGLALVRPATWMNASGVLPAAVFSFTLVHAFYWSDVRMRAPLIPILAVLAASAVHRIFADRADAAFTMSTNDC